MVKRIISSALVMLCLLTCAYALTPPDINAGAAILAELSSGEVLYEKNADAMMYPASTTKLVTAILAMEYGNPDDVITVNASALAGLPERGSAVYLIAGEEMQFMDMLRYLLIGSGNDAANAIAEHISGSQTDFVALMNTKAKSIGCQNTHFANAHGLHEDTHYTCARDMLLIAQYFMKNETLAQIVAETAVTLPVTNKHAKTTTKYTTNHLLSPQSQAGYYYSGAIGIKTGTTTKAGLCLAAAFEKDDLTYYTVVLGASKDENGKLGNFSETIKLFDYAANNFSRQIMLNSTEPITEVAVRLASDNREAVVLYPSSSISALLPADFKTSDLELRCDTEESVDAPVAKGQALGTLHVLYNGKEYGTLELVANEDIQRSEILYIMDRITAFFQSTVFRVIVGALIALIVIFLAYAVIARRRRKRRRRYGGGKYRR
ncbi:MAG: D-alanyl-D-alanine carboxypeptidase [Clostridia bacterium]|nr:D-alanyl-D-alanine carboxypeptidase [Clostridia bacterium]